MTTENACLLFPADFFHPKKHKAKNVSGNFQSADVKVYVTARNNPALCAACALQNDRVSIQRAKAERVIFLKQKESEAASSEKQPEVLGNQTPTKEALNDTSNTFSPSILERPGGPLRVGGYHPSGHWECRLYTDPVKRLMLDEKKEKPRSISVKDTIENSELISECTFQPDLPLSRAQPSGEERGKVFSRLYEQGMARIQERKKLKEKAAISAASPSSRPEEKTEPQIFTRLYEDAARSMERKKSCSERVNEEIQRKFSFHPAIPTPKSALKSPGVASPVKRTLHFAETAQSPNRTEEELGTYSTIVTENSSLASP